jgi:hypothetical protein
MGIIIPVIIHTTIHIKIQSSKINNNNPLQQFPNIQIQYNSYKKE